jgi:hypothetical protein
MDRIQLKEIVAIYGQKADYPQEAVASLANEVANLSDAAMTFLNECLIKYEAGEKLTYAMQETFEKCAGVHCYVAQMLFYMAFLPSLSQKYEEKKLSAVFLDKVLFDLRAKLHECHTVYGIWGSFVAIWFARFFNFTLYGIERLEFAPFHAEFDYEGQGVSVKKGDFVIDVHIPSGAPLPYERVIASYRAASAFFGCDIFVCESWMLYPAHREMLVDCPNLMAFFADYDVVESAEDKGDLWRIFGARHEESPENLPRDTKLRAVYADRLQAGLPVGWGKGIFVLK